MYAAPRPTTAPAGAAGAAADPRRPTPPRAGTPPRRSTPPRGADCGEAVRVVVRVRPMLSDEGGASVVDCHPDGRHIDLLEPRSLDETWEQKQSFAFDSVFGTHATQYDVYEEIGPRLLENVFAGYNAAVIAYGQTGSGKTYTMHGRAGAQRACIAAEQGIVPRLMTDLFARVCATPPSVRIHVECSYVQIYKEETFDLLKPAASGWGAARGAAGARPPELHNCRIKLREVTDGYGNRTFEPLGVTTVTVRSQRDISEALAQGERQRVTAPTGMNDTSSRSHSIFCVTVAQATQADHAAGECAGVERTATLYLVDLAGSECAKRTGAEGSTLAEASSINKSLSSLRNVILALTRAVRPKHIPYRDSELTKFLRETLGGNARTTLICNVSPTIANHADTKNTMEFGKQTQAITNVVRENVHKSAEELLFIWQTAQAQLLELREEIRRLERKLPGVRLDLDAERGLAAAAEAASPRRPAPVPDYWTAAPPEHLCCPLMRRLNPHSTPTTMVDPVLAQDGHTYERSYVESYWRRFNALPHAVVNGLPTDRLVLFPNLVAERQVLEWRESARWPSDVLGAVFTFLAGPDMLRCLRVSSHWNAVGAEPRSWEWRVEMDFGADALALFSSERHRAWARYYFHLWAQKERAKGSSVEFMWKFQPPRSRSHGLRLFPK
eukprot:TRINITY_DN2098_c1_g1_i6.p1 TRINITY_DN2098_c1_g1~~TRINITY_DN2098_c1_g1_i6.p1  ORF type:complete len:670 (+),score=220.64 TRINITY_DN2098_c1_g1_i6:68-2077(+)